MVEDQEVNASKISNKPSTPERVKQLAIYYAIQKRNIVIFELILTKFMQCLEHEDLIEIAGMLFEPNKKQPSMNSFWVAGFELFLRSETTQLIYRHLKAEEVHSFISLAIIEPMLQMKKRRDVQVHLLKDLEELQRSVLNELKSSVYSSYAGLKYPTLFLSDGSLDKMLSGVTEHDLVIFILAKDDRSNIKGLFDQRQKIESEGGVASQQKLKYLLR